MRIFICLLLILFTQVSLATINPSNRTIELSVEAELNKTSIGRITLAVEPGDNLLLKWDEVETVFNEKLYPQGLTTLKAKVVDGMLSKQALEKFGFVINFDLSDFSLKINAPLNLTRPQTLSLKSNDRRLQASEVANLSGFVNLYSSYLYQQNSITDTEDKQLAARAEMVMNWRGWVVENELEYLSDVEATSSNVKRLGTRLVHDLPLKGARISIGDNYSSGSYFQSTSRILGVSFAHDFSLVSDRQIRPSASRSFTLDSPSSVEVLVDDRIVQRLNLTAGIYSLDDIPLNEGSNNISLRITDIAGVVRYVNFDVTTGLDLFAEGQLEYEVHIGVPSELTDQLDYNDDYPLISTYLDYGISPSWTVGFAAQADEIVQQVGFKNIYAAKLGQVAFENSVSFSDKRGYAYRLVYSNFTDNSDKHLDYSFGYEYSTKDFRALGYRPELQDSARLLEHLIQANYSFFNSPTLRTSFFANVSRAHDQVQFDKSAGVNFTGDVSNGNWRYSLGAQWDEIADNAEWGIRLSLTYKFSNDRRLKLSHQSRRNKTRLEYTQDANQRYVGAFSLRTGIEHNDQNEALFDLNTQYNGNRFLASLDHASFYEQLNASSAYHQSRVSFASSVAFAGDDWAIGKPIYDSFALIKPHSSLKDKKITLGQYKDQYRANNADFDTMLLNDLSSYDSTVVSVDIDDLAPGYDLGSGLVVFFPSYRSGHSVMIGTAANISVIATLLDQQQQPLALQVGVAICSSDKSNKEHKFFTNKSGRFALTGLIPCSYEVKLNNSEKSQFILDVKEGEQLQRKGNIYVH
ncbi:fimbrial biogenesis outer membrane usher protein [Pseudoalteromonas sp. SG44-5]|uniref:fimbria/pilus outer membrane usher protein n=1 Tax=Pseudoalteromonas sp. SG44-5 TaxID=2760960 RepID=UPI0015F7E5FB|nr:fimbria/pilus outer membrane usher protein [Pseudoalteromonas sp. SG44-5]MBB1406360.1 fimbrial biogenesis outer membrane usher protein [Pseudoalteromonas sp. SG44-5]